MVGDPQAEGQAQTGQIMPALLTLSLRTAIGQGQRQNEGGKEGGEPPNARRGGMNPEGGRPSQYQGRGQARPGVGGKLADGPAHEGQCQRTSDGGEDVHPRGQVSQGDEGEEFSQQGVEGVAWWMGHPQ